MSTNYFHFHPLKKSIPIFRCALHRARITTCAPPPFKNFTMTQRFITSSRTTSRRPFGLIAIVFLYFLVPSSSQRTSDAAALLKFKDSLKNGAAALSDWTAGRQPCGGDDEVWIGVLCDNVTVWGLQLENMGLEGGINVDALSEMRDLRALSFMNNNFEGNLPNISKLGALKTIYLSNNKFSGEIPSNAFNGMLSLKKIYLSNNSFSGPIPSSLTSLQKLMELKLDNNKFEGQIPSFRGESFKVFNVSHNRLAGEIPNTLSKIDASAFGGNEDICGAPLKSCSSPTKLSVATIIVVTIVVIAAVAALVAVVLILSRRKHEANPSQPAVTAICTVESPIRIEQGSSGPASSAPDPSGHGKKSEQSVKLTFLRQGREQFDMADLLKASAEILGSGVFGSTYKAALNEGKVVVVKRFRHMNSVTKQDFHEHMTRLGRLDHQNLLPIVAFYYRKEEKLLVTDFVQNVSLAVHLHGNKSRNLPTPDWPTRLNVVKGVARGLNYLYNELPSLMAPHGHLKSSNVLLDGSFNPLLTDYGLVPVVNQEHAQEHMISYKTPEFKQTGRVTKKTDIWSFGILILEILTGRFPSNFLQQGRGSDADLTTWVESVMKDNSNNNAEVFDGDMEGTSHSQGEMMKLLKIGLSCCQADVDSRPDISEVLEKIEEVKEKDDDVFFSSYTSEADRRSSSQVTDGVNHVTFR